MILTIDFIVCAILTPIDHNFGMSVKMQNYYLQISSEFEETKIL